MKRFIKGMCMAALVLVVLGIGLGGMGFAMGGALTSLHITSKGVEYVDIFDNIFNNRRALVSTDGNKWHDEDRYDYDDYYDDDRYDDDDHYNDNEKYLSDHLLTDDEMNAAVINSLRIELGASELVISPADKYSITVTGSLPVRSEVENGTLRIRMPRISAFNVLDYPNSKIIITVPKGKVYDYLQLTTGAGLTTADGMSAKRAKIEVGAGSQTMTNFVCEGELELTVGASSLEIQGDLQRGADIDCGMGKVVIGLTDSSDVGYSADVGMGNVNIVGNRLSSIGDTYSNRNAKRFFDIDCGMGSVEIS